MEAGIEEKGPLLKISVTGRSFLTNMVRIIVGTMDEIATGRKSLEEICRLLDGGSRGEAGPTAPAEGLFLWGVRYDPMPFGCEEYNTVTGNFIL
jgi:tRNA pseudouridine38-40 synthase